MNPKNSLFQLILSQMNPAMLSPADIRKRHITAEPVDTRTAHGNINNIISDNSVDGFIKEYHRSIAANELLEPMLAKGFFKGHLERETKGSVQNFLEKLIGKEEGFDYSNLAYRKAIEQLVKESGSPYINVMEEDEWGDRMRFESSGKPRAHTGIATGDRFAKELGEWKNIPGGRQASWELVLDKGKGIRTKPDTMHVPPDLHSLIAELGHAEQFKNLSPEEFWAITSRLKSEKKSEEETGISRYIGDKTIEGYAHNVLQPLKRKRFETLLDSLDMLSPFELYER
jgi:hypothetical protein|tara:strand:+ start:42 stop:896 length:855 start_codon:yes stop_codon:yes gene_type:complete